MKKGLNIKLIILFGSRAKGTAGKTSDYDVAVLADRPLQLEDKFGLSQDLAKEYGYNEDKIEIVDLWSAPPLLQHEIAKHGKLLKGNELDFLLFRVSAWKQFQDTAKLRKWQKEHLRQRIYGK